MNTSMHGDGDKLRQSRTNVRPPDSTDFPAMLEISNWATRHTTASFRTEPETLDQWVTALQCRSSAHPWYVAERHEQVAGFAMASPFNDRCGFAPTAEVSVYVHPDHQGTGVGTALYRKLIPTLAAQGLQSAIAAITVPNPGSEVLHERFGFRKTGVLSRVGWKFGRWHDVAYWQLLLRNDAVAPAPLKNVSEAESLCGAG
jgi:L-amino acid N-acyltransferase YncA